MSDEFKAVTVLNGEVQAGDRVAYATREGNRAQMHLGIVVGFGERKVAYEDTREITLKVQVTRESALYYEVGQDVDELHTIGNLHRVVKL
jgi:hypothetical protein